MSADPDELDDILGTVSDEELESLLSEWAAQGLLNEAIEQEGFLSFGGAIPEHIDPQAILEALEEKGER